MAIQTTYTHARANLAALCDEVTANREVVIIHRRGAEDVALIAAADRKNKAHFSLCLHPYSGFVIHVGEGRVPGRRGLSHVGM